MFLANHIAKSSIKCPKQILNCMVMKVGGVCTCMYVYSDPHPQKQRKQFHNNEV